MDDRWNFDIDKAPRGKVVDRSAGCAVMARVWTDEAILEALHMSAHDGKTYAEIGKHFGVSRSAISGLVDRIRRATDATDNGVGDGTMQPGWWRRG